MPVVSVTSEVSANTSFQNAAAKSARPDSEPAGNDSFAALVGSNTAASNNDTRTQDKPPAPRRSDDTQAASNSRARDNAASDRADNAARNESNDRNAAANARSDKAREDGKSCRRAEKGGAIMLRSFTATRVRP